MTFGRAVASVTASLAVAGCAVVALGMSHTDSAQHRTARLADAAAPTARPAHLPREGAPAAKPTRTATPEVTQATAATRPVVVPVTPTATRVPSTTADTTTSPVPSTAVASRAETRPTATHPTATHPAPTHPATTHASTTHPATTHTAATHTSTTHTSTTHTSTTHTSTTQRSTTKGHSLPLGFTTGNARKVITVVARSHHSTTATLQAWSKVSGGWARYGSAVTAAVGSDGLSKHASESKSATPIGTFTLTRAFGHDSDPGTSLPYVHTTPSDWWISQAGKLYNTLQVCSSHCSFNQGNPNEHLYYETPYYDYAVVIDYNTRNAPGGVRQGAGSAFFLHVHPAGTGPTAGCVSIPKAKLVTIMRWLTPQSHARILIGT